MNNLDLNALTERLFAIFSHCDFLGMKGLANEVPIFIQSYDPLQEDGIRRMVDSLTSRLLNTGVSAKAIDFFDLVLEELEAHQILEDLIREEKTFEKAELLDTLRNYSDPQTHLVPRLIEAISEDNAQLTLITGARRVFPFLRTHTILESLQPAMLHRPMVIFFPGEYAQDPNGGSQLRLFGSIPTPGIQNAYYRAINLEHYRL